MNADTHYVDPSALRRLYVHDDRSRAFCSWRARKGGGLPVTLHGRLELTNSINLAVHRGDIEPAQGLEALRDVETDFDTGRLYPADLLWRRALTLAVELSNEYSAALGTRTLDVLHVASAKTLTCRILVTYDQRQATLARKIGLKVLSP